VIPDGPYRAALRRRWAELIRRVYEIDPLVCPRCGGEMRVVGFITQPALIDRIPRSPEKAQQGLSPASVLVSASGQPRLRSTPPQYGGGEKREMCRPATRAQAFTRLWALTALCASWSSGCREPTLEAQLGRSGGHHGPCRARPEEEVPIPYCLRRRDFKLLADAMDRSLFDFAVARHAGDLPVGGVESRRCRSRSRSFNFRLFGFSSG